MADIQHRAGIRPSPGAASEAPATRDGPAGRGAPSPNVEIDKRC